MRRSTWLAAGAAVLAAAVYFLFGGARSSIRDDSVATPAAVKSRYGNCIEPRGTYTPGLGVGPVLVETELGTRDVAGTFTPRPDSVHAGFTSPGVGGHLTWSAGQYMGLPRGTYVVKATLVEGGGAAGEPRPLATCYSAPLTFP